MRLQYNTFREGPELFIVAYVNEFGVVTGFPTGGGSSTESRLRVFTSYEKAKRSSNFFEGSTVVSTKGYREVKGEKI